jgi:exodeoxyribonuclease VII large subunit
MTDSKENHYHNIPEYSVSDISFALKQTVEGQFSHIRVKGELSGFKKAPSGHAYFTLKDDQSVLSAVCWRGSIGRLAFEPEDGLEVVCTGRLSIYPGRSQYQMVVDFMEPAGTGALMALLEKRKAQLAKEGLFDESHKKPLPFIPRVIGVITSPTGAVIRDILHRLEERFPCHVLVWPVMVQGDQAATQVQAALEGFNRLIPQGKIPRPDVVIVARGGGSIEDLWPFNEERVVRAVYASEIPVISAVGHETDTTLIDYVADKRAPTPTAAAEFAVPVREELLGAVLHTNHRMQRTIERMMALLAQQIQQASRLQLAMIRFLEYVTQRLDNILVRKEHQAERFIQRLQGCLERLGSRLIHPNTWLEKISEQCRYLEIQLQSAFERFCQSRQHRIQIMSQALKPIHVKRDITRYIQQMVRYHEALESAKDKILLQKQQQLMQSVRLMDSYHYKKVLSRGFALVWGGNKLISTCQQAKENLSMVVEFADGKLPVIVNADTLTKPKSKSKRPQKTQENERLL